MARELDKKIYELCKSLGGTVSGGGGRNGNGIVTVTFPDGEIWDFTTPMQVDKDGKALHFEAMDGPDGETKIKPIHTRT